MKATTAMLTLMAMVLGQGGVAAGQGGVAGEATQIRSSGATASAAVVTHGEIPRGSYTTWSLFLVCNPEWLLPEKNDDLRRLYESFKSFGRAIGDDNLAVWFWKSGRPTTDRDFERDVDVERSVRFCRAFKLKPSVGPHILVLSSYPDTEKVSKDYADYALGGMSSNAISALLAKITDELVIEGKVAGTAVAATPPRAAARVPEGPGTAVAAPLAAKATGGAAASVASATENQSLWIRLLVAAQKSIVNFGCAWSFKVNAAGLEANLRPCEKHK